MPKMKTHKSTAKRLKVTGTGKVVHKHAGGSHLLAKKSSRRKRRLRVMAVVNPVDLKRFRPLIQAGGEL